MKPTIACLLLLALLVLLDGQLFPPRDLALLRPTEVLYGAFQENQWIIRTDTGDTGQGPTWESAMADLEQTAPGTLFQGTVSYVLLEQSAPLEPVLADWSLSPNCGLCRSQGEPDPETVAPYLRSHATLPTMGQLRDNPHQPIPLLLEESP